MRIFDSGFSRLNSNPVITAMKTSLKKVIFNLILVLTCCPGQAQHSVLYDTLPFNSTPPVLPVIPDARVSLLDFGGVPDGLMA